MQRSPGGMTDHTPIMAAPTMTVMTGTGAEAAADHPTHDAQEDVLTSQKTDLAYPSMYRVLLLNDDYTPMDFVVFILERFFDKSADEAHAIMLEVHNRGSGVCGVYTYEIAETKVGQVMDLAQQNQHPLQCTLEKA